MGGALLTYDYDARLAFLDDPPVEPVSPHAYVLCISCADRLDPPRGWLLDDRRTEPPLFMPQRLGSAADGAGDAPPTEAEPEVLRRQLFFGTSSA